MSHEPHFTIIREVLPPSKKQQKHAERQARNHKNAVTRFPLDLELSCLVGRCVTDLSHCPEELTRSDVWVR